MKSLLLLGASNTYGIVGGGVPGPDGFPRGRAYKDVLRERLTDWTIRVRGVFGSGGIDWPETAPFLPDGNPWFADPPSGGAILLYGEAGPDEVSRGMVHPWRDFAAPNLPCDAAVLMVGTGDAIRGWPLGGGVATPPSVYGAAIRSTVHSLLEGGASSVILPVDTPIVPEVPAWTALIQAYQLEIYTLWAEQMTGVVPGPDLMVELADPAYYDPSDTLHPNEFGHERIADLYQPILEGL